MSTNNQKFPSLPIPMYFLPFEDQDTWITFTLNFLSQIKATSEANFFGVLGFSIFICVVHHCFIVLGVINETISKMGENLKFLTVDQWIQQIVQQINDVNAAYSELSDLFSTFFLIHEMGVFCALLVSAFLIVILKQQQLFGLGVTMFAVCLFIICYINDAILGRFSDVSKKFYNEIPWYELSPCERKSILMAMNCKKIQFGFTASGTHRVRITRFTKIIKIAYTNIVALKNLVEK
ncbi:uncharacterized protein LOC134837335 [Culicoides brevitarsis]|uniref:uncharacterized protein LOC134837335 n=1 Tax=Culicoides brevitarsis TaxID=469753 RepID=UPI00307C0F6C